MKHIEKLYLIKVADEMAAPTTPNQPAGVGTASATPPIAPISTAPQVAGTTPTNVAPATGATPSTMPPAQGVQPITQPSKKPFTLNNNGTATGPDGKIMNQQSQPAPTPQQQGQYPEAFNRYGQYRNVAQPLAAAENNNRRQPSTGFNLTPQNQALVNSKPLNGNTSFANYKAPAVRAPRTSFAQQTSEPYSIGTTGTRG